MIDGWLVEKKPNEKTAYSWCRVMQRMGDADIQMTKLRSF
jgi:hypothetical protein